MGRGGVVGGAGLGLGVRRSVWGPVCVSVRPVSGAWGRSSLSLSVCRSLVRSFVRPWGVLGVSCPLSGWGPVFVVFLFLCAAGLSVAFFAFHLFIPCLSLGFSLEATWELIGRVAQCVREVRSLIHSAVQCISSRVGSGENAWHSLV